MDEDAGRVGQDAPESVAVGRRPTMRDVAVRAGVSKALVSLVFRNAPGASPESHARVLQAAAELGYRHNRTASLLARRRDHLIGVSMILRNTFHAELAEEIQAAADELGYEIALSPMTRTHDESRSLETLLELRCEALIILGAELSVPRLDEVGRHLPVVVVGRRIKSPHIDVVRSADDQGIGQVVDHMADLGHRADVRHSGRSARRRRRRRHHASGVRSHVEASKLNRISERRLRAYGSEGSYRMTGTDVQVQNELAPQTSPTV